MDCLDKERGIFLVSACLMGLATRYDGRIKESRDCRQFLEGRVWLSVCPEQLGGLATPRPAADIVGGDGGAVLDGMARVMTGTGDDVSARFIAGARQVLAIVGQQQICGVCLKSGSPSCAVRGVQGVTAALLARHGLVLYEF